MNATWKLRYCETSGWAMEEFVAVAGRTLAELGLGTRDTPNERLVRYYAGEGAMTKPAREGREARYSYRHLVEFLLTRMLIEDGWPLAKIAELMGTSELSTLEQMLPDERAARTAAQREVDRLKRSSSLKDDLFASSRAFHEPLDQLASSDTMLERQSELSSSRYAVVPPRRFSGLHGDKAEWRETMEIELTPWCRVAVDATELATLDGPACEMAGQALTQALRDRRLQRRRLEMTPHRRSTRRAGGP